MTDGKVEKIVYETPRVLIVGGRGHGKALAIARLAEAARQAMKDESVVAVVGHGGADVSEEDLRQLVGNGQLVRQLSIENIDHQMTIKTVTIPRHDYFRQFEKKRKPR